MFKVTERGTEKIGGESNFKDMDTILDIFEEAGNKVSSNLCQEDGRWVSDVAAHLKGKKLNG